MTPLLHGSLAFLMVLLFYPQQQTEFTGDWYFDRFGGPHGEILHTPEIDKANKQQEGYKFTFTKDGKFKTVQSDGTVNTTAYQYLADRRQIIVDGDTMKIVSLTSREMGLRTTKGKLAVMLLRRNKEVKKASTP